MQDTHFSPQPNDDEALWDVIEITAEKPTKYKVKWDGIDPTTGKAWKQSWVAKADCTDDLKIAWINKIQAKAQPKGMTLFKIIMLVSSDYVVEKSHIEASAASMGLLASTSSQKLVPPRYQAQTSEHGML